MIELYCGDCLEAIPKLGHLYLRYCKAHQIDIRRIWHSDYSLAPRVDVEMLFTWLDKQGLF